MNLCRACGSDFSSVGAFDAHRVGKHEYDFDYRQPERWDGRRCLSEAEIEEAEWQRDKCGRWQQPISESDRERFSQLRRRRVSGREGERRSRTTPASSGRQKPTRLGSQS
jgi:hypothetical protein